MNEEFLLDIGFYKEPIDDGLIPYPTLYRKAIGGEGIELTTTVEGNVWIEYVAGDEYVDIGVYDEETLPKLIEVLEIGINSAR